MRRQELPMVTGRKLEETNRKAIIKAAGTSFFDMRVSGLRK
jgi:hypothetical protein